ncbi:hypothetical protein PIB30_060997 [Stylosanthes scabra]|uniref:Uncharacterized protein n=1 Tax=Stylosanthes scabra TaxID=79078 RepID=A0ABU6YIX3_9FABA|nr:hypothetical protein [Stylosanthes scabra]
MKKERGVADLRCRVIAQVRHQERAAARCDWGPKMLRKGLARARHLGRAGARLFSNASREQPGLGRVRTKSPRDCAERARAPLNGTSAMARSHQGIVRARGIMRGRHSGAHWREATLQLRPNATKVMARTRHGISRMRHMRAGVK